MTITLKSDLNLIITYFSPEAAVILAARLSETDLITVDEISI